MSFANIELAWLLLLLPMLIALVWWRLRTRKRRLLAFSDQKLLASIYPNYHRDAKSTIAQATATLAVGTLLVVATLRPQWGYVWTESSKRGVDIVIAVDVSESMLAEDVSPNRLDRARFEIYDLLEHLRGDRIALVAFAGAAFIESPLTVDYGTFRSFLKALHPEMIPLQGTNIEAALTKSIDAFGLEKDKTPAKRARAIVLITDGESFDGDVTVASKKAEELNIRIYVLGIGTEVGAPIPQAGGYKKDRSGNIIVTKLKPQVLEDLAKKTKGIFVQAITSDVDTKTIYDQGIKAVLEDAGLKGERAKRWNEYYQVPLFLALLIMLLQAASPLLFRRKVKEQRKKPVMKEAAASIVVFLVMSLMSPLAASAQVAESLGESAKKAYDQGAYDHALEEFNQGAIKRPEDYRFGVGKGSSYYRLQKYSEATRSFIDAADKAKDPLEKARALYNAGNSLLQEQRLDDAIKTYEDSLVLKPNDKETLENLAYAKRLREQEKKEQQNKQENNKDKNQDQEQSEQEQQEQQSKNNQDSTQQQQQQSQQQSQQQQAKDDPSDNKPQSPQNTSKPEQQVQEKSGTSQTKPDQKQNSDQATQDLASSLLDNVEENKKAFIEYRKDKAMEELKAMQLDLPENDW